MSPTSSFPAILNKPEFVFNDLSGGFQFALWQGLFQFENLVVVFHHDKNSPREIALNDFIQEFFFRPDPALRHVGLIQDKDIPLPVPVPNELQAFDEDIPQRPCVAKVTFDLKHSAPKHGIQLVVAVVRLDDFVEFKSHLNINLRLSC